MEKRTKVAIVGVGKGGIEVLKTLSRYDYIEVILVVDINPKAEGMELARTLGIHTATEFNNLLSSDIDLVINTTGKPYVSKLLHELLPIRAEIINGASTRLFWKLNEDLNRQNRNLEILNTVTQAVYQFVSLEDIYNAALDSITKLENVDMAMIYLVDEKEQQAVLQAHRNVPEEYIRRAERIPYPKGITWKVINSGKIINVEDAQKDPDIGPAGSNLGHHSILGIPIFLEERVIGVIWFLSYKERKFNEREVYLLSTLGNQIAVAIARAKQTKELEERNKRLSILSTISQTIHQSIDLNQVYSTVLDVTKDLKFINLIAVYLVEGEGDKKGKQYYSSIEDIQRNTKRGLAGFHIQRESLGRCLTVEN